MPSTHRYLTAAVFLTWLTLRGQVPGFAETEEDRIYWADMHGIYWSDLGEGTTQRIITADTRRPSKVALDVARGKMYWVDKRGDTIHRSDLDGSNSEVVVEVGGIFFRVLAIDLDLDLELGKIYFLTIYSTGDTEHGGLYRANLDGSEIEFLDKPASAYAVALDPTGRDVWIGDREWISRLDLNGSDFDQVSGERGLDEIALSLTYSDRNSSGFEGFFIRERRLGDMALDIAEGKVYWTNPGDRAIHRSNLDGSDVEDLLVDLDLAPAEIALDPEGGKVYWTVTNDWPWDSEIYGGIRRANLDGSEMEHVVERGEAVGITLDLEGSKLYWTDARGTIQRANLDGSDVEDLFAPLVRAPYAVALDAMNGRIYWTDLLSATVQRAGVDGSEHKALVQGLDAPRGVCLGGGRLYWADSGVGKIQSSRLDGSDMEDVATGLKQPDKVALDPVHGRIYWTERNERLIKRADLDGADFRELRVDGYPNGIALDPSGGRMYWTWRGEMHWRGGSNGTGLSCSSLEGSDTKALVAGDPSFEDYRAIAIDLAGGKIHWTRVHRPPVLDSIHDSPGAGVELFRSSLDGSNVEEVTYLSGERDMSYQWGLKVDYLGFMGNALALDLSHETAVSAQNSAPLATTLLSSYPNPFNGSTLISYTLAAPGPVTLVVYNTLGQPVRTLVDQVQAPGPYSVPWQPAETLASGVYLYRLITADAVLTRKLALLR